MDRNEKLRQMKERHRLTAQQVAEIVGVKVQTVRSWLCAARTIPREKLIMLKNATDSENDVS